MAVERESIRAPLVSGLHSVYRVYRAANGQWSMEVYLDITAYLPDGRHVKLQKVVNAVCTQQRGRRKRAEVQGKPDAR